jgi:hypothetical protein
VSLDPADEREGRLRESMPGLRYFYDFDGAISRRYGAIPCAAQAPFDTASMRRFWIVLDPTLRVLGVFPFARDGSEYAQVFRFLDELAEPARFAGIELQAPVLYLRNVFEPEFCRALVSLYEQHGGAETGFMREVDGRTVQLQDYGHKRRKDYVITDQATVKQAQLRIQRRVVPEILKVHQFKITRMERNIVACYTSEDGGHFSAHRDHH